MRNHCTALLKNQFRVYLIRSRQSAHINQEEMAHRLMMAGRSYAELEHGNSCCGAVTLVLFFLYMCPDPTEFLQEFRIALEKITDAA